MLESPSPAAGPEDSDGAFAWPRLPGDRDGGMVLVDPAHALRGAAEACIRDIYGQAFQARDPSFPPMLVALPDAAGRVLCAAGLRTAIDGFFSERYLDMPIERALQRHAGTAVARHAVFEVTTLASRSAELTPGFVRQIGLLGRKAGFAWTFFTATDRLRRLLAGLGLQVLDLAPADPRRLADSGRWGRYYDHAPRVCAVDGSWLAESATRSARLSADA